jgi:DNA repair photolyase
MLQPLYTEVPDATLARAEKRLKTSPQAKAVHGPAGSLHSPARQLSADAARKILRPAEASDFPFRQTINPYRGCELGCVYCYARPAHGLLGLSPTLDFATRIFHKNHAARLLRRELGKPGYQCLATALGTNTDVYQSAERELLLTRSLLEVLYELRHPVTLMTKSSLILRDLELLSIMARSGLAQVLISLCTLDNELARVLEPQAASPQARLETIRKLSAAGIPVGVVVAPVIPGLTDLGIEELLAAAYAAGARSASHAPLHLPRELLGEFDRWLMWHACKPVSRLNAVLYGRFACKAGKAPPANPIRGFEHYAGLIEQRFLLASQSLGFAGLPELNYEDFRASPKTVPELGNDDGQGHLF